MVAAPIQRGFIGVDLGGGVDTFTDPKMVLPGSLIDAQNVRYNRDGVIQRRNGMGPLGELTAPTIVDKLLVRDEQLAAYTRGGLLNRYDGTRWVQTTAGYLPVPWAKSRVIGPTNNGIGTNLFFSYAIDVASNVRSSGGTEMAVAYCADNTAVTVDIFDCFTGAVKQSFSITGPATDVRIAYCPNNAEYLVAINTAVAVPSTAGPIKVYKVKPGVSGSTLVWTSPTNAVGGLVGFDFCYHPNDGVFVVFYCAASNVLTVGMFADVTYSNITAVTTTAASTPDSMAIARPAPLVGQGIKLFVVNTGGAKAFFTDGTSVTQALFTVSANTGLVTACTDNAGNTYVSQKSALNTTARYKVTSGAVVSSLDSFLVGTPASTLTLDSSQSDICCYQWMTYQHVGSGLAFQNCFFLARLGNTAGQNDYQPVGRILYGRGTYEQAKSGVVSLVDMTALTGNRKSMSAVLQTAPVVAGNPDTLRTQLNLATFGLDPASGWQTAEVGKTLFVTGGHLAKFDGTCITENGFLLAPEKPTLSAAAGTGALAAGDYQVTVVYVEVDAQGNTHRSAAGIPATITLAGGSGSSSISVQAKSYAATNSFKQMRLELYRTEKDKTVFYREAIAAMTPTGGTITVTLGAVLTDAQLAQRPKLYTDGGVEDTYQPSAPIAIAADQSRAYAIEGDNLSRMIPSRRLVPGNALAFFPDYFRAVEGGASELTGLAALSGRKFAFKKRGLCFAAGDGADDTLASDTLSQFEERSKDIGAVDPRSIVATQEGVVFRSQKGFYLLGLDSALTFIGADVDAYSEVNGFKYQFAAFNKDTNEIYWVSQSATPAVLVLKLFRNKRGLQYKWTTATLNGQAQVKDVAVWGGAASSSKQLLAAALGSTSGGSLVALETPGVYSDAAVSPSAHVQQLISTGWIKLNGITGFGRLYAIYVLGSSYSSHQFNVDIAYDYESTWFETQVISSVNATVNGSAYLFKLKPSRQRCAAFRLRIYDSAHTNAAKDTYDLSGLMLDVGVYGGGARLRAEKNL